MKKLSYSILINNSPEVVFKTITKRSVFPEWAKAWGEGMDFKGEWKKGEHVAFFDQTQGGTKVVIEDIKEFDYIKAKHIAMVNPEAVEVELGDEMMKKWIGTLEQYYFHEESKNQTRLEILIETDEAFEEMMKGWHKALELLKEICEQQ